MIAASPRDGRHQAAGLWVPSSYTMEVIRPQVVSRRMSCRARLAGTGLRGIGAGNPVQLRGLAWAFSGGPDPRSCERISAAHGLL